MNDKKLSDLTPQRQNEVVQQRIDDMKAFTDHTIRSRDPLCWAALELDAQARLLGVDMNYAEDLEDDEIE